MRLVLIRFLLVFPLIILLSCEEIPIVIADPVIPDSEKVVLIEELTGASCPNCPKGSAAIENILTKFPGRVAVVGIHGDFLSNPTAKSKYDFRNPKAKSLENWFQPWFGKPSASINRVKDENDMIMIDIPELWQAAVENELLKPHQMNLLLDTKFNAVTRKLDLEIAAIPLTDLAGSYNISIFLTESDIIDAQSNGAVIIDAYNHKHVLRDMMTKFDGDNFGSDLKKDDIIKKNYTYTLPIEPTGLWNPAKMEVVVMISRATPTDVSVVQAAYKKVVN
ncbi:MAG: Omp28-related outer membrane protein [Saprospiraceae bacterium]|nr:Omp28-related outer membrane protein [Saprospiraceae bacterium]